MTVLLDQAIGDLAERYSVEFLPEPEDENAPERAETDTWEEICEYQRLLDELDYQKCLEELEQLKNNGQGGNITQ